MKPSVSLIVSCHSQEHGFRDNPDIHAILEIKGEDQAMTIGQVKLPDQAAVKFLEKKEVSESKEQEKGIKKRLLTHQVQATILFLEHEFVKDHFALQWQVLDSGKFSFFPYPLPDYNNHKMDTLENKNILSSYTQHL